MSTYYDNFQRQLTLINQFRLSQLRAQQSPSGDPFSPNSLARAAMTQARPSLPALSTAPVAEKKGRGGLLGFLEKVAPVATPGLWLAKEGSETSPGRAVIDILSRGTYAASGFADEINDQARAGRNEAARQIGEPTVPIADEFLSQIKPYFNDKPYKEAWKGLTGEDKTTGADVVRENNPGMGNKQVAATGLLVDILGDPLSLLPVGGTVNALGKATTRLKPAVKPTEAVVEEATKTGLVPDGNNIVGKLLELPAAKPRLAIEAPKARVFEAGPEGLSAKGGPNVDEIVRQSQMQAVIKQLKTTPRLAHPEGLSVPSIFKTAESTEVRRVPREVTEEVEVPAETASVADKPRNPRLSKARAVKASLLQTPDYRVGKFTVGDLLKAAKTADPEQVKQIDTLINTEAKRIVSEGSWGDLPNVTRLYDRTGKPAAFGLTLEQMTDLMQRGAVGGQVGKYGTQADEFTKGFPIHDVDDLNNVFMNTSAGERITMREYLDRLGIQVKAVSESGEATPAFGPVPEFGKPQTRKVTQKKTVYDEIPLTKQSTKRMSRAESVLWAAQHAGRLSPEEIAYLRKAGSPASFDKRLAEIKARTIAGEFSTLDDFIDAASQGMIPKEAVDKMLAIVGVKKLSELKAAAERIMTATGPKKAPAPEAQGLKVVKGEVVPPAKVQRFKAGSVPEDDFSAPKVTTAEELADRPELLKTPAVEELSTQNIRDLAEALPFSVIENLVDPQDLSKYPFLTDIKKAKRTSKSAGSGRARNLHGWHSISQSDVFRSLVKSASKRNPVQPGLKGKENALAWKLRQQKMYDEVMPALRGAEQALRNEGVKIISGTDNAGLMLSFTDVLDSLPRELVERHLFNPRYAVMPTEFLDAADGIVRAMMGRVPLDIAKENAVNIFANSPKLRNLSRQRRGGLTQGEEIAVGLADTLLDHAEVILQRVELNYARHGVEVGEAVKSMTDQVIDNIIKKYANPDVSIGEAFGDFVMRADDTSRIGRKVDAPTEAFDAARQLTDAKLGGALSPGDFAEAKATKQFANVKTEKQAAKIGVQQSKSRSAEGLDSMPMVNAQVDLGDRFQTQLAANMFRANVPMLDKVYTMKDALGRAFVSDYGHARLHESLRVERSVTQDFSRMHRGLIAQLSDSIREAYGPRAPQASQEAFKYLQRSIIPADEQMAAVVNGLKSSVDLTFGSSVDNIGGFAQRNGIFAGHLNEILDFYKAPKNFRFDPKKPFAEQTNAWREWTDVEDPLSLLDVMHAAMQRASVEVTLGRDFSANFGSAVPKKGWVKVTDNSGTSKVGRFIDQDLYYPRDMVEQLKYLDDVMKGSINRIKNPTAESVIKQYDKIVHAWKSGLTIYRPGHHVRNLIGDVTLAFFDGVTNPAVYYKSVRILSRRSAAYQSWDGLKALETGTPLGSATDAGKTGVKVGRKRVNLTDDQIWRAAFDQGIIPDYRTLEDIAFNQQQSLQFKAGSKISLSRPTGGWAQRKAGGVSQARDHMVRIAHFVHVLERGNFGSLDEAFDQAGRRVRKWHPDGTDLTNFENAVARRTFMFYSWMRKAIPLVVETLVMKPGKAMLFPKAAYAFAEANGVDLDSLSNPFPVDQLFPEFLTDQVIGPHFGEAGDYGGINPGEPVSEMVSQWGSGDPDNSLMGALTPVARVPAELFTNTSFGTGASITDKSDYLDSQIPHVGQVARISGHSVTGLGEPTRDVERGNTEAGLNNDAFINFLTGIGLRDYSKPNYIRRAELEKRDRAREARNG